MPKVTEEHKQAMRQRIQDAALTCFARKGFAGASMADIVKEAGLSAGAVYVYYTSKAELMIDVGRRAMEPRLAVLDTAKSSGEVTPPSTVFIELLDSLLIDNPVASILIQVWSEASYDEDFASFADTIFSSLLEEFVGYLERYLQQEGVGSGAAREQATVLVPAVLAMIQGAVVQSTIFGEEAHQRVRAGIENLLQLIDFSATASGE